VYAYRVAGAVAPAGIASSAPGAATVFSMTRSVASPAASSVAMPARVVI